MSLSLSVSLSLCLSMCGSLCLYVSRIYICLHVSISLCLPLCIYFIVVCTTCLSMYLCVCMNLGMWVYMSVSQCLRFCVSVSSVYMCLYVCVSCEWFSKTVRTQGPPISILLFRDTGQSVSSKISPTSVSDSQSHFLIPTHPHTHSVVSTGAHNAQPHCNSPTW